MGRLCGVITLTSVLSPSGPVNMSLSHSSQAQKGSQEQLDCVCPLDLVTVLLRILRLFPHWYLCLCFPCVSSFSIRCFIPRTLPSLSQVFSLSLPLPSLCIDIWTQQLNTAQRNSLPLSLPSLHQAYQASWAFTPFLHTPRLCSASVSFFIPLLLPRNSFLTLPTLQIF